MTRTQPAVDISTIPDLVRLAEEVRASGEPLSLWRDSEEIALLMPFPHHQRIDSALRSRRRGPADRQSVTERTAGALKEYRLARPLTPEEENEAFERAVAEAVGERLLG